MRKERQERRTVGRMSGKEVEKEGRGDERREAGRRREGRGGREGKEERKE